MEINRLAPIDFKTLAKIISEGSIKEGYYGTPELRLDGKTLLGFTKREMNEIKRGNIRILNLILRRNLPRTFASYFTKPKTTITKPTIKSEKVVLLEEKKTKNTY